MNTMGTEKEIAGDSIKPSPTPEKRRGRRRNLKKRGRREKKSLSSTKSNMRRGRKKWSFSFFPSKEQRGDKRLLNRMKICALAITLMWASSLRTAAFIASFAIDVPESALVFDSCTSAIQVSMDERTKFSHCADVQASQCEQDLDASIRLEELRVEQASQWNTDIVAHGESLNNDCASDYMTVRGALEGWVNGVPEGQTLPVDNRECTLEETETMLSLLIDVERVKAEAVAISADFAEESQLVVANMIEYAQLRMAYDRNYLYNHTNVTLKEYFDIMKIPSFDGVTEFMEEYVENFEIIFNCTGFDRTAVCPLYPFNMFDLLDQMKADVFKNLQDYIEVLEGDYKVLEERLQTYMKRIDKAFEVVESFYNGVKRTQEWLASWGRNEDDPIFDWDINIFKAPVPNFPSLQIPSELMNQIQTLIDQDLYEQVAHLHDQYVAAVRADIDTMWRKYNGWKVEIEDMYDVSKILDKLVPDDYDPPRYTDIKGKIIYLDDEGERFERYSKEFVNQSTLALDTFANAQSTNGTTNVTRSLPKLNFTAVKSTISNVDLNFERLKAPSLDFNLWFLEITSIVDFAFLVDYAFRIYFTIRLCFKYWDAGYIKLPPADVRTQKEIKNPFKQSNGRLLINLLTNPLVGGMLVGSIVAWFVGLATSAYLPLFREYRSGCIPNGGNGTFVAENLFTSSYNFAYREGSSILVKRVDKIELERTNTCSVNTVSSTKKQNDDSDMLTSFKNSIQSAQGPMGLFERCIDSELTDALFRVACCNQTGYEICDDSVPPYVCPFRASFEFEPPLPFSPPGKYLERRTCDIDFEEPFWKFNDAIFQCSALPPCDITCKSPNKDKLRKVTKECGCITEWLLHSLWLRTLMSFVIFVIMNVSRVVLVDGIARVIWRHLHPRTFTMQATSNESGGIITKENTIYSMSKNSCCHYSTDEDHDYLCTVSCVKEAIEKSTKPFEMMGWAKIVGALLSNILWIIIVFRILASTKMKPML